MNCVTKLELDTLEQGLALEIAFACSCALSSMLINRVGKFAILCKYHDTYQAHEHTNKNEETDEKHLLHTRHSCFDAISLSLSFTPFFSILNSCCFLLYPIQTTITGRRTRLRFEKVFAMFMSGSCGIGCMLINIPFAQIVMFIVLFMSGIGTNIVNSSTVEIYPTQTRYADIWIHT